MKNLGNFNVKDHTRIFHLQLNGKHTVDNIVVFQLLYKILTSNYRYINLINLNRNKQTRIPECIGILDLSNLYSYLT